MKKMYSFKIVSLFILSAISFIGALYLLYQLYLLENTLFAPLAVCIATFTLFQYLIFSTLLTQINTQSDGFEQTIATESMDVSVPEETSVSAAIEEPSQSQEMEPPVSELLPISDELSFFAHRHPSIEMDIISAARDAMESLTPFAEAQNIKLHLSATNDKLMIMAEPESIRILFRNIIDNSIKYMGRAGHMIITISLLGDDIFVILKDTGKGLSEDETTHVFELNFQGSNRVSGNGLGLTQTKMIVEAFGGTIYAKSSPENGMAIYIQLPVSGKTKED